MANGKGQWRQTSSAFRALNLFIESAADPAPRSSLRQICSGKGPSREFVLGRGFPETNSITSSSKRAKGVRHHSDRRPYASYVRRRARYCLGIEGICLESIGKRRPSRICSQTAAYPRSFPQITASPHRGREREEEPTAVRADLMDPGAVDVGTTTAKRPTRRMGEIPARSHPQRRRSLWSARRRSCRQSNARCMEAPIGESRDGEGCWGSAGRPPMGLHALSP